SRQPLRSLVRDFPAQVEVRPEHSVVHLDDKEPLAASIRDKRYNPVTDAHAVARLTKPSGATIDVPLRFTTTNDVNTYSGDFKTDELGQHRIELISTSNSNGPAT